MLPLYITHHGESYTARFNPGTGSVESRELVHPGEWQLDLRLGYQKAVVAIQSMQQFDSVDSFAVQYDRDLVQWAESTLSIPYAGCVNDSEAVLALLVQKEKSLPALFQFCYLLENRFRVVLVQEKQIISQIHFAESELTQGIEALLTRASHWYQRTTLPGESKSTFLLGTCHSSSPSVTPLFSDCESPYLVAAGVPFVPGSKMIHRGNGLFNLVRTARISLLIISLILLISTIAAGVIFTIQHRNVTLAIEESNFSMELPESAQRDLDSLLNKGRERIKTVEQINSRKNWSRYLEDFTAVPYDGISVQRLGSRDHEGQLEFAFEGVAQSDSAVTNYVSALKNSDRFDHVTLTQMDRISQGKQRFRIQCSVLH